MAGIQEFPFTDNTENSNNHH